jgi:hypothetical protein
MGLNGKKCQEAGEDCIMRSFITCVLDSALLGVIKSKSMRWAGHIAHMDELRSAYKILVRKPEG